MPELTVDPRAYIRPSPARGHLGRFYCIPYSLHQAQSCSGSFRQVLLQTLEPILDLVLPAVNQVGSTVYPRAYIRPSPARGHLGRFYCIPQSLYKTQSCPRSSRQVLLYTLQLTLDLVLLGVIYVGSTVDPRAYIRPSCLRSFRQVLLQTLELILDLVLVAVIQVRSTVDPRVYIRPSSACGHLGRFCCRPYCILRK